MIMKIIVEQNYIEYTCHKLSTESDHTKVFRQYVIKCEEFVQSQIPVLITWMPLLIYQDYTQ